MPTGFAGYDFITGLSSNFSYTASTTATDPWPTWTQTTYTSSATATWTAWVQTVQQVGPTLTYYPYHEAPQIRLTPEQVAQEARWRREEEARQRERRDARLREEAEAVARAKALLESCLTSEQIAQLAAHRWFEIVSQRGNRYRIHQGRTGNVRLLKDGRETTRYCIHPAGELPDEDAMLAQKLLLETDEAAFERIANRS